MVSVTPKPNHDRVVSEIRKAGMKAISQKGIDRISVSQICDLAKNTRPTFYSYFGNIDGLLADIWISEGDAFLSRLADPSYEVMNTKLAVEDRALVEIFAIAHRVPEVAEVVNRQVIAWWSSLTKNDDFKSLKFAWLIGERLGALLMLPVDPTVKTLALADKFLLSVDKVATIKTKMTTDLLPAISDPAPREQSIDEQLLAATVNVIANSGVKGASMARIARYAQVTTGSVYPRFSNIGSLVIESFEFAAKHVVTQNLANTKDGSFGPDEFGLFVTAGLLARRKQWRNYRLEAHIEGRINKPLAKRIQKSNAEVNIQVSNALRRYDIPEVVLEAATHLIHSIGIGFTLLFNAGIALNELDHRRITRQIVVVFEQIAQKPSK
jgi:AcrR family transcriptional regulator